MLTEEQKEYRRQYYQKNKEAIKLRKAKFHAENPHRYLETRLKYEHKIKTENPSKYLWSFAKRRAKQNNILFDIEPEDIIVPEYCPILGIKLTINAGNPGPNSPSIDRLYPELGYVKGNVYVISHRANRIKNNASVDEIIKIAEYIKERTKQ